MNVAALVLAAGGSTRLGSPKQLLEHDGKMLLRRAAEAARAAGCGPVLVVLGSGADRLADVLAGMDVRTVVNPDWRDGMGTSVRRGMETLDALAPGADGALLTLCDQPLVGAEALGALLAAFEGGAGIAAAWYDGTVGVPAVFGRAHFAALRALPDAAGAKGLLQRHRASLTAVPLPEAAVDIDTREQFERFNASLHSRHGN